MTQMTKAFGIGLGIMTLTAISTSLGTVAVIITLGVVGCNLVADRLESK